MTKSPSVTHSDFFDNVYLFLILFWFCTTKGRVCLKFGYSDLSATTGSFLAADRDGRKPEIRVSAILTPTIITA